MQGTHFQTNQCFILPIFFGSKIKVVGGKRIDLENTCPVYHWVATQLVLVFNNVHWFRYGTDYI